VIHEVILPLQLVQNGNVGREFVFGVFEDFQVQFLVGVHVDEHFAEVELYRLVLGLQVRFLLFQHVHEFAQRFLACIPLNLYFNHLLILLRFGNIRVGLKVVAVEVLVARFLLNPVF